MVAWKSDEVADLSLPWGEFRVRHPNRSNDAYNNKKKAVANDKSVIYQAPRASVSDEEYLAATIAYQRSQQGAFPQERVLDIAIETNKRIAVCFPSDWHIGSKGCDLQQLWDDCRLIASHPRVFAAVGGDPIDNFGPFNHPTAMEAMVTDRASQWKLFRYLVGLLHDSGSLLWVSSGNHDAWTRTAAGIDGVAMTIGDLPVAYTHEGALVRLRVGQQTYRIYRKHKPQRFRSGDNPTHFLRQMLARGTPWEWDIGVSEHIHQAEICVFEWRPGSKMDRVAICTGSYKVRDEYAEELGYYGGGYGVPTVVLDPQRREMIAFTSISHAIAALDGVPNQAAA